MGTGPNLYDVLGRVAGTVEGFRYSQSMIDYGKEWGFQNMYDYLEDPKAYVPGTNMSFAGIRKREDRINLIEYLRTLSDAPMAIPAAVVVEAPADPLAIEEGAAPVEDSVEAVEGETEAAPI